MTIGLIEAGVGRRTLAGLLAQPAAVARSHVGAVRRRNEDRWLARTHVGLWAVADGMGGHEEGDTASSLVVEALGRIGRCDSGHGLLTAVNGQIAAANAELRARGAEMAQGAVIGATIVALLVFEAHCAILWAGDSRAYRLRRGRLEAMTRDHRLVQDLLDSGQITAEEAASHPMANVITRAVGVSEHLDLETRTEALEVGDRFVLASDGLTDVVADDEIASLLAGADLESAADDLLALSLARGAGDNVTFILIEPKV